MSNDKLMVVPGFAGTADLIFDMKNVVEAESRLPEIKTVNPITYVDLEHTLMEAYRDVRRFLASIGFQITQAEKQIELAKANVLLGSYADHMQGKPKYQDNGDARAAFFIRDKDYAMALDRLAQLKALESLFDTKQKVFEKTSAYMKKQMDLVLRSGLTNRDLYAPKGLK